jgi:hypothetical protein
MEKDKARQRTERKLDQMEKQIGRVYQKSPALLAVVKELKAYMAGVQKRTETAYNAYKEAEGTDDYDALKNAYMAEIRRYTVDSMEYKAIIKKFVAALAKVNEQATDISNNAMYEVYAINYNQVAEDCRKAGISVNGEK